MLLTPAFFLFLFLVFFRCSPVLVILSLMNIILEGNNYPFFFIKKPSFVFTVLCSNCELDSPPVTGYRDALTGLEATTMRQEGGTPVHQKLLESFFH